ncbi:MAG TPA: isocitrate lyase/phosphoenolpyruvate mutase family protein [Magnetospirillaceae bacterium]|nr:isocitrate lyase/phosphoenolpyruvate mutase family protein [Magnetospirillaceae bacterium]
MTDHAKTFRQLHHADKPLLLANAWDAGSARLIESLGASAVATTSAGIDWALGYPDGNLLPIARLAEMTASITRLIRIPLSVDFEAGYSDDPAEVAENIKPILDAGAVGINIEDGGQPPALLAAKIERVKGVAAAKGIDLFVNARTDVYLRGLVPEPRRIAESLARGKTYREAGADGLFVPGLIANEGIEAVVKGADLPVNLLAWPGLAGAEELGALGVKRISAGSGIAQRVWAEAERLASDFLRDGRSEPLSEGALDYGRLQQLFAPH